MTPTRDRFVAGYIALADDIHDAGLMRRRPGYYAAEITVAITAFAGIWVGFALLGNSWFQLLLAGALGLVVTRFGFLGHDAAHRQIFDSVTWNAWTARILAGGFAGLSYSWWQAKHARHHRGPNRIGIDPDIAPGAISFTPDLVEGHRGAVGWLVRHQGWFFFPLLTLEGFNLHLASVRSTMDGSSTQPWRRLELTLVLTRLVGYVAVVTWFLPIGMAAAFIGLQTAVFGVCLGASFAPAHKGMPMVPASMRLDFLRRQVLVSRNVRGGWVVDFLMGGLNYQIEHHLFPSMPRCNLRRARPLVRDHCARVGVPYTEVGLVRSYALVVGYLNNVGLRARDPFDCPLADGLRGG